MDGLTLSFRPTLSHFSDRRETRQIEETTREHVNLRESARMRNGCRCVCRERAGASP